MHITGQRTMKEYLDVIKTSQTLYVDEDILARSLAEAESRKLDLQYLCLLEMRIDSGGRYSRFSKDNLIDFLEDKGVDFEKRFVTKTGAPSLDLKKTIEPLIEKGIAVELLTMYKEMRAYESYANFMRNMPKRRRATHRTVGGHLIGEYMTNISEEENLRVYYSDLAFVSVPKVFSNMITGPDETWHIAWADYPQADWRFAYNLFIKDESNEAIMRACDDSYEGLARIVEGDKFDPEEFKGNRKLYKVDCLSTFYNSANRKPVARAMHDYFNSRAKYKRYIEDLAMLYRFKLPVPITSYFGYEQLLPEAPYESAFLSKGLNTPIQTFTSHVVNETVLTLLERFWDLGYTSEDINIYYVRHDEIILLFRDSILKDSWVFKDCSEIHIDGFTPIHLDFHFGNNYREEDEKLTEMINLYKDSCDDRLHMYPAGEVHEYNPVPSVESVYMIIFRRGTKYSCRFHHYRTGQHYHYLVDGPDYQTVADEVISKYLVKELGNPKYLLVMNQEAEWMNAAGEDGDTLMKVIIKSDGNVVVSLHGEESEGTGAGREAD